MSVAARLSAFVGLLLAVFAAAAFAGDRIGWTPREEEKGGSHGDMTAADDGARGRDGDASGEDGATDGGDHTGADGADDHGATDDGGAATGDDHGGADTGATGADDHGADSSATGRDETGAAIPPGLASEAGGLRLALEGDRPGRSELRFRIRDASDRSLVDFDVEHTKRMHLIVVRRDLTGFRHLHPRPAADGSWRVPLRLRDPGSYRVFADFSHRGAQQTLGSDLTVPGADTTRPLPEPNHVATTDGFRVALDDHQGDELRFQITRNGRRVTPQPYLGALGHLVALRASDLAYLHVHPSADRLAFATEFPSEGRYRLFLQFKVDGRVHTVAYTKQVQR